MPSIAPRASKDARPGYSWAVALRGSTSAALASLVSRLRVTVMDECALLHHRHCERSEAIQSLSAEEFWIASLRSQ